MSTLNKSTQQEKKGPKNKPESQRTWEAEAGGYLRPGLSPE